MNRMLLKLFLIFFFSICARYLPAQETVVRGIAEGVSGATIEIGTYSDFIIYTYTKLVESKTGSNGSFELILHLDHTRACIIRLGQQQVDFVIEPGKTYTLRLSNIMAQDTRKQVLPHYLIPPLDVTITDCWQNELNGLLHRFNKVHDDFMAENHVAILRQGNRQKVQEYVKLVYDSFPGINNEWFNHTLSYTIAQVELMGRSAGKESLVAKYIDGEPILYFHPTYIEFFLQIFDKYLLTPSSPLKRQELKNALEAQNAFLQLLQLLASDPLLKNQEVREMVLLKSLWEFYSLSDFNKNHVIKALQQATVQSKTPAHKTLAANMLILLQQ